MESPTLGQEIGVFTQEANEPEYRNWDSLKLFTSEIHRNKTTIASHLSVSGISRATAINDLNDLLKKGFTKKKKVGRTVYFYGTEQIKKLIKVG